MTPLLPARDAIVATAEESIARGSRSFALASKLFDRPTRQRAWLLYAWCRRCDDLADGQDHGHDAERLSAGDAEARLAEIRSKTAAALAGEIVGDPAFDALRLVAAETGMPPALPAEHIAGFALDAAGWRPRTEEDLLRYCWHVAGVVGCMMAVVMGVSPDDRDTLDRATDLGIAFQLANIARDVAEDHRAGRCYLPADWLAEAGIDPADLLDPRYRPQLAMLTGRLAAMAERYEASARVGAARLPFRSRWAVLAAAGIYGGIARIVAAEGAGALDHRVTTSGAGKAAAVLRALGEAFSTPAPVAREGLWTRP